MKNFQLKESYWGKIDLGWFKLWLIVGMATGRVTRNRTGPEPLGTETVCDRFRTAPNCGTVKPPEKNLPEPWNRRKKLLEPDLRTAGQFTRTTGSLEPVRVNRPNGSMEPVRVNWPNCSLEPEPEPAGWTGPAVLWNRPKSSR